MIARQLVFFVLLLIPQEVFAQGTPETPGNFFFQICDFKEMKGGDWTRPVGCTKKPEGDSWKSATVFIIPGHSALALKSIREDVQSVEAMARARFTQKQLEPHGFANFVITPEALEIGSRVLVLYAKQGTEIDVNDILSRLRALEDLGLANWKSDIENWRSDVKENINKLREGLDRISSELEKLVARKLVYFEVKAEVIFLPARAVLGPSFGLCYRASEEVVDLCAAYGVGWEMDYDKEPENEFIAHFVDASLRLNFLKRQLMVNAAFLYEADRDKKFYGNRDFKGGKAGAGWRFGDVVFIEGFGLIGAGTDVLEKTHNKFTLGGGASLGVNF